MSGIDGVRPNEVSRRTLIAGAVWSVPTVMVLTATPAFAASSDRATGQSVTETSFWASQGAGSGNTQHWLYGEVHAQLGNVWPNVDGATFYATVLLIRVADAAGKPVSDHEQSITLTPVSVSKYGHAVFSYKSATNLPLGTWKLTYSVSAKNPSGLLIPPGVLSGSTTQTVTYYG